MKTVLGLLQLNFIPRSPDVGLLVLRLLLGGSLLLLHGMAKVKTFSDMSRGFPDPFSIGHKASLSLAIFGEVVCSALLILGLFTRIASLGCVVNMSVAFFLVHKMALSGPKSGELAFLYLAGFVALFLAGPGRFAVDSSSGGGKASRPTPQK